MGVCVCVVQRREGVWQGEKSQPQGAPQIIPASLLSEPLGGESPSD